MAANSKQLTFSFAAIIWLFSTPAGAQETLDESGSNDGQTLIAEDQIATSPDAEDLGDEEYAEDEFDDDNFDDIDLQKPSQREADIAELRRHFEAYKSAIEVSSYDEADTLAKRMIELSIGVYGLQSHEAAKSLSNLGLAQQRNKEFEAASLNFSTAIDIIEQLEDRLHEGLVNPLRGLGAAQLGIGRPDLARVTFDRAVHITHVNEGPHNKDQIRVLEDLAETHLTMGNKKSAISVHKHIFNIEARNSDIVSLDMLPALRRRVTWQNRMRMHDKERMSWRQMIQIIEKKRGKKDLSLIPPLTGLARSYLYASDLELENHANPAISSGDTYLRRALKISRSNPDATWEDALQALLALGDFYTLSLRPNKAAKVYAESWSLLSEDDSRFALRERELEKPKLLQSVFPPKYYRRTDSEDASNADSESYETGTIVVGYRITDKGLTRDIKVIDAEPSGLRALENSVMREVRRLIHRPQMVDGVSISTPNRTYVHEYFYEPESLPTPKTEDAAVKETEKIAAEDS